jgi:hypothetical protein
LKRNCRGDDLEKFQDVALTCRDNRVLAALVEVVRDRSDGDIAVAVSARALSAGLSSGERQVG